jgi:hypothetical protein
VVVDEDVLLVVDVVVLIPLSLFYYRGVGSIPDWSLRDSWLAVSLRQVFLQVVYSIMNR